VLPNDQGDPIGRIFARWVIIYHGQFFYKLATLVLIMGNFIPQQKLCINFWGDIFTNSSVHPGHDSESANLLLQ
jgi:hypothetical protein